jgi:hypothetical protein
MKSRSGNFLVRHADEITSVFVYRDAGSTGGVFDRKGLGGLELRELPDSRPGSGMQM